MMYRPNGVPVELNYRFRTIFRDLRYRHLERIHAVRHDRACLRKGTGFPTRLTGVFVIRTNKEHKEQEGV